VYHSQLHAQQDPFRRSISPPKMVQIRWSGSTQKWAT